MRLSCSKNILLAFRISLSRQVATDILLSYIADFDQFGESMSDEDLKTELERLRNENAAFKKVAATGIQRCSIVGGCCIPIS